MTDGPIPTTRCERETLARSHRAGGGRPDGRDLGRTAPAGEDHRMAGSNHADAGDLLGLASLCPPPAGFVGRSVIRRGRRPR